MDKLLLIVICYCYCYLLLCLISLSQELDYATNFLANGPGQWKDSGLGQAFRAAVANPDIINIIDWKPYGFLEPPLDRLSHVFCLT